MILATVRTITITRNVSRQSVSGLVERQSSFAIRQLALTSCCTTNAILICQATIGLNHCNNCIQRVAWRRKRSRSRNMLSMVRETGGTCVYKRAHESHTALGPSLHRSLICTRVCKCESCQPQTLIVSPLFHTAATTAGRVQRVGSTKPVALQVLQPQLVWRLSLSLSHPICMFSCNRNT